MFPHLVVHQPAGVELLLDIVEDLGLGGSHIHLVAQRPHEDARVLGEEKTSAGNGATGARVEEPLSRAYVAQPLDVRSPAGVVQRHGGVVRGVEVIAVHAGELRRDHDPPLIRRLEVPDLLQDEQQSLLNGCVHRTADGDP